MSLCDERKKNIGKTKCQLIINEKRVDLSCIWTFSCRIAASFPAMLWKNKAYSMSGSYRSKNEVNWAYWGIWIELLDPKYFVIKFVLNTKVIRTNLYYMKSTIFPDPRFSRSRLEPQLLTPNLNSYPLNQQNIYVFMFYMLYS